MAKLILPADDLKRLIRQRRRCGGDRFDEVWDGVYVMSPLADNEHQSLGYSLCKTIEKGIGEEIGARIFQGTNVSDRADEWKKNYRCPDVAIFLPGNPAEDCGTHWLDGPDFAVEILSRGDRARKKFDFYAAVGVRELMLVDRRPWRLELYRRDGDDWAPVGVSTLNVPTTLPSDVLGLAFRLLPGEPRPRIEITRPGDGQRWLS